jgi:hypothetical protein
VTGHWSSWQAARVEVKQETDADVQDVMDKLAELDKKFENLYTNGTGANLPGA